MHHKNNTSQNNNQNDISNLDNVNTEIICEDTKIGSIENLILFLGNSSVIISVL